jgi:hypothetical protein
VENGIIKVYKPRETCAFAPSAPTPFSNSGTVFVDVDFRELPIADAARQFSDKRQYNVIVKTA